MNNLRLEYLDPDTLTANPSNWRQHPKNQTDALKDILDEVGWAGALLFNEATGHLIDGHARKDIAKGEKVPVLIGSWSEDQEKKILATLDPLAAMAGTDQAKLDELLSEISTQSEAVQQLLESLSAQFAAEPTEFPAFGGEGNNFHTMSFSVTDDQKQAIEQALSKAKTAGPFDSDNPNSNGNALSRIAEAYVC